jgi:hypothetical protein
VGKANIPEDCLGFQVGEVSQLITEKLPNEIRATRHHVRGAYGMTRKTFALFFSPGFEFIINSQSTSFPDRYVPGMTFEEWHFKSLARYAV